VFSISRLIRAFGHSVNGLKSTFASETAFKQEVILCVVAAPIIYWIDATLVEKILLIISLAFVLMAELVNTAIEAVVDRISHERHELSKKAKDVGSGVVLVACINAAVVWLLILLD